ncbi:hypothetical protein JAAARDRAFT_27686 [Jaapia argillacea MUCL 33604]|uniref:Inosine triphosphate pyrophosphatase n=1 Tax=Jaapia argillacea MUCL 33604 TaxID=933084 RepID=A0A067QKL9_9AGAM|nr:hypothetical protein JAAARDRAFT_27686 [Jaapia argillacea MUCL 33604]
MSSKPLVFVTGNANKLKEVKAILSKGHPIEIESRDLDLPEIQGTPPQIATAKAHSASTHLSCPTLTEDTALCFTALHDLPGPYIKHFLQALGHTGLNTLLSGFEDKRAYALCTFAYCPGPGEEVVLFEGRTEGRIVPARGGGTFGWDPIFEVEGTGKTYAEMDIEEKNALSHRYKALAKVREYLISLDEKKKAES